MHYGSPAEADPVSALDCYKSLGYLPLEAVYRVLAYSLKGAPNVLFGYSYRRNRIIGKLPVLGYVKYF